MNMETKVCKTCGKELPIEEFELEHTKYGDRRRGTCRICRAEYRKQWRKNNPELYHAQATRHQNKQTEWLYAVKKPCIICGESEPICIDFHHINPEEKDFTIGQHRGKNREWLLQEISKCVCLCANCHRKVHAGLINLEYYINNESSPCSTGESVTE